MKKILQLLSILFFIFNASSLFADNGYRLWLKYDLLQNKKIRNNYKKTIKGWKTIGKSETMIVINNELETGLNGLLGKKVKKKYSKDNYILAGSIRNIQSKLKRKLTQQIESLNNEGFLIKSLKNDGKNVIIITGKTDIAVLYGTFHFLRLLQTEQSI